MCNPFLSYLQWNPNRVFFTVPGINHDIVWYGVFFALGFVITYFVLCHVLKEDICTLSIKPKEGEESQNQTSSKQVAQQLADRIVLYIVSGLVIGARLGYVFFYGWPLYKSNPLDIFKLWMGGLASHGACTGILIAGWLLVKRLSKTSTPLRYTSILDILAIISGFFAAFIRFGNFMNQEILGKATQVPWAVVFLNPFDGGEILPRHPVQLYEAFFYLLLALTLFALWKKKTWLIGKGQYAAFFLSFLFTFRFLAEFFKEPQGVVMPLYKGLTMGQYLSIPFILGGSFLLLLNIKKRRKA